MNAKASKCVAQGAAVWNEACSHKEIMEKINKVCGHSDYAQEINGMARFWRVVSLPIEDLRLIFRRNRPDEILPLIHNYGRSACPPDFHGDGWHFHNQMNQNILPEEIQELIARRNRREEIDAYISYQGFGEQGQNIILDRGDHDEIMRYVSRHGFLPAQQRKLLARNNQEEIGLHIFRHGLAVELLNEMFDRMDAGGGTDEFYAFISRREFPVPMQIRMLETVKSPEFYAYISRYGLWHQAHMSLLACRSEDEIAGYLERHHFLTDQAEEKLAAMQSARLNRIYIREYPHSIRGFVEKLLKIRPLDYEALTAGFLKLNVRSENEKTVELMKNGTREQVIAYFRENEKTVYGKELIQLFFRNDPEVFETCLALIGDRCILE